MRVIHVFFVLLTTIRISKNHQIHSAYYIHTINGTKQTLTSSSSHCYHFMQFHHHRLQLFYFRRNLTENNKNTTNSVYTVAENKKSQTSLASLTDWFQQHSTSVWKQQCQIWIQDHDGTAASLINKFVDVRGNVCIIFTVSFNWRFWDFYLWLLSEKWQ